MATKKDKTTRMTGDHLQALIDGMSYDLASFARLVAVPYRTLQDYVYNKRRIPPGFAQKARDAYYADRRYMQRMGKRLDKEFSRMYPHGIVSEVFADE